MSGLVEFLLARIAEDKVAARDVHRESCEALPPPEGYNGPFPCDCHVPTRILSECEAKRRIISLHRQYEWPSCDGGDAHGPENCETLRLLASIYADHPDFRAEWGTS